MGSKLDLKGNRSYSLVYELIGYWSKNGWELNRTVTKKSEIGRRIALLKQLIKNYGLLFSLQYRYQKNNIY